jgi:Domain of unknown function (DUF4272)
MTTEEWAQTHSVSVEDTAPAIEDYTEPYPRSAREIATRVVILQGVVAVAYEMDAEPVVEWLREQGVWDQVSPREQAFLLESEVTDEQRNRLRWHQEAEWALLWAISHVESLGLPTQGCDTRRLVDEIVPPLGSEINAFLDSTTLRPPGELLAEDDRTYNLWCYATSAVRRDEPLPADLRWWVLYERRYAFEWLDGLQDWDEVTCDA